MVSLLNEGLKLDEDMTVICVSYDSYMSVKLFLVEERKRERCSLEIAGDQNQFSLETGNVSKRWSTD